jgi:hypothetical protein
MHPAMNEETLTLSFAASLRISASISTGIDTDSDCVRMPGGRPRVAGGLAGASLLMSLVFLCRNNAEAISFLRRIKIVSKNRLREDEMALKCPHGKPTTQERASAKAGKAPSRRAVRFPAAGGN